MQAVHVSRLMEFQLLLSQNGRLVPPASVQECPPCLSAPAVDPCCASESVHVEVSGAPDRMPQTPFQPQVELNPYRVVQEQVRRIEDRVRRIDALCQRIRERHGWVRPNA